MNRKLKLLIISLFFVVISITTVYAVTLIKASDVIYDNSKSGGTSNNVQGAIDELYGMAENNGSGNGSNWVKLINENIITYVTNLAKTDTANLAYDDTADKNLRYIGANPNNYVEFNGELWRIIGIMNNVKDANGVSASRVKLIRHDSIGKYSFDNQGTRGINDWARARLMTTLNSGPYWNRTSGTCYAGLSSATTPCDFSSNGLTNESKKMISSIIWNLGGWNTGAITSSEMYTKERGTNVYSGNATTWKGYVALFYPSDYGYAVGGPSRSSCLAKNLSSYNATECYSNDWLFQPDIFLTPYTKTNTAITTIMSDGRVCEEGNYSYPSNPFNFRPVVFLDTELLITKGEGTENNPYKISFEKEIQKVYDTSNATPPKIDDEEKLKPVTLADDGAVTYVSKDDDKWYNYSEKKWANAVILVDSPSQEYKVGDVIKEADIESYFVWIPKYKYRLWNTGTASKNAHEIDIVFDTKDTTDVEGKSCKTPMTSGETGNCDNGEYMTHPAFISLGVDGFWVGKFETGYKGATSTTAAEVNSSDSSKIIVKPNVYSWRKNTVYNIFVSSYNYKRSLDSHMMKNTEWGAVAYLSHSKYGLGYEVNINNNSSYKTGYSALPSTNQHQNPGIYGDGSSYNKLYNTEIGYLASTTGNITGIYDLSGGSGEYMASYISGKLGSSGFNATTLANYNDKYFDVYNSSSNVTTYQYRILGDAIGEMGPFKQYSEGDNYWRSIWYGEFSQFVETTYPWIRRGGNYLNGGDSGQFNNGRYTGGVDDRNSSRIVLTG